MLPLYHTKPYQHGIQIACTENAQLLWPGNHAIHCFCPPVCQFNGSTGNCLFLAINFNLTVKLSVLAPFYLGKYYAWRLPSSGSTERISLKRKHRFPQAFQLILQTNMLLQRLHRFQSFAEQAVPIRINSSLHQIECQPNIRQIGIHRTVGNVNEETIREYIRNQEENDKLEG